MDTLQGLTQLNQVPVDMTLEGMAALRQRQQTDAITLQELARKQQHEQQMDPLRIRQQQLANDVSLQNLGKTTRDNREADFTSNARMQDELKKHLLNADASDLAQIEQQGQRLAYSTNPRERATGQQILLQTKAAIQEREKIRLQGVNSLAVANVGAASRERAAGLAATAKRAALTAKTPKDWQELAVRMQQQLFSEADPEARAMLSQQIQYAQQMAERLKPAQQAINPENAGGMFVDPRGAIPPPPAKSTGQQASQQGPLKLTPKHEDWITRAMAANPGATRAQIIEQGTTLGKFK